MKCASIILSVKDGYINFPQNGNIMPHTYAVYHSFTLKRKKLQKNTRFLLDIFVLFRYNQRKRGGAAMFIKSRILTVLDCIPVAPADVETERELMELAAEKHRKEP